VLAEVQVVPAPVDQDLVAQLIHDTNAPALRPSRTTAEVWGLMREYAEDGGMLDIGEDIAALTGMDKELRELDGGGSPLDVLEARRKLITSRVAAKAKHLDVQRERRLVITHDRFMVLMEDLGEILMTHLGHDPAKLRQIAHEFAKLVRRLREQGGG